MITTVPPRSDIPLEHTWDITNIYQSATDWEMAVQQLVEEISQLTAFRGRLGSSSDTLADWLETSTTMQNKAGRVFVYAHMARDVDTADQAAAAKFDRASEVYTQVMAATSFAEPEMLDIGFDTLKTWATENKRLTTYTHYFAMLEKTQSHIRSGEVEELLSFVQSPFTSARALHGTLADADLQFQPAVNSASERIDLAQGNIHSLLTNTDREIRRTAWENYADAHLSLKNIMASCIATGVKQNVFMARARKYDSALEAALSQNYIPTNVFHSLIETYRSQISLWHRYWNIRRRALGYDTLHVYDVAAPLTEEPPHIPFTQSLDWICEGMQPLGDDYVNAMRRGVIHERWVDIYPNKGKRAGAYSSGFPGTNPFILMSYTDDIFSMSTLAHELGHSMHSFLTWQNQPLVYGSYSIFVAEVASNFNQALVRAHLLNTNSDPDFQIAVIEEAMANFYRYFFIMPILAQFELEIHQRVEQGKPLTADSLNALMTDLFREGYGNEVDLDADRTGITWAQFPTHLYANFYVYQYATGISAAHALANKVLSGESDAVNNYLSFLKAGSSVYPLDALTMAGVDMNSSKPVEQTFGVMSELIDRLEELVNQRQPVAG
ncbi:MAG: oligoendopeptidase F [Chloroflexota bacterium]